MIKKFWILTLVLVALPAFAGGEPFEWSRNADEVVLTVSQDAYVYADSVKMYAEDKEIELKSPESKLYDDPFAGEKVYIYEKGIHRWIVGKTFAAAVLKIDYQGCSGKLCLPPKTIELNSKGQNIGVEADPTESSPTPSFRRFDGLGTLEELQKFLQEPAPTGMITNADGEASIFAAFGDKSGVPVWLALIGVLFGGMLLNLTPCILPLIPLNLAFIGAGDRSNGRSGFVRGLLYGSGMTIAYGLLGVAVLAWGMNFGALNSSWIFNYAVSLLFLFLALAMFGVFNFDLSQFQSKLNINAKWTSGIGITFLGAVSALLAGTCVAPVVIGVLLWAAALQSQGVLWAWGLPFMLGLGMALPWPFAGAGIGLLPRAGEWTRFVKWGFGGLILLVALYYGYLGTTLALYRAGDAVGYEAVESGIEQAREAKKILLIDFWASWCKNCDALDSQMKEPQIQRELERYFVLKVQAENMNAPVTKELLARFGIKGLPALVVINP